MGREKSTGGRGKMHVRTYVRTYLPFQARDSTTAVLQEKPDWRSTVNLVRTYVRSTYVRLRTYVRRLRTYVRNSLENGRSLKRDTGADALSPRASERYSRRTAVLLDVLGRTPVLQ